MSNFKPKKLHLSPNALVPLSKCPRKAILLLHLLINHMNPNTYLFTTTDNEKVKFGNILGISRIRIGELVKSLKTNRVIIEKQRGLYSVNKDLIEIIF